MAITNFLHRVLASLFQLWMPQLSLCEQMPLLDGFDSHRYKPGQFLGNSLWFSCGFSLLEQQAVLQPATAQTCSSRMNCRCGSPSDFLSTPVACTKVAVDSRFATLRTRKCGSDNSMLTSLYLLQLEDARRGLLSICDCGRAKPN